MIDSDCIPYDNVVAVSVLCGETMESVERQGDSGIVFRTTSGTTYLMAHRQSCCESVYIEDICGDLGDLVGSPILHAEESTNADNPKVHDWGGGFTTTDDSHTWTFYRFRTMKGSVVIRWYGSSSGYYSESVDLMRVDAV